MGAARLRTLGLVAAAILARGEGQEVRHDYIERSLVQHEGSGVGDPLQDGLLLEACSRECDAVAECRSFSYSRKQRGCYLKDRRVTADDPARWPPNLDFNTHYQSEVTAEAPQEVVASFLTTSSIDIRWDVPAMNSCLFARYLVQSRLLEEANDAWAAAAGCAELRSRCDAPSTACYVGIAEMLVVGKTVCSETSYIDDQVCDRAPQQECRIIVLSRTVRGNNCLPPSQTSRCDPSCVATGLPSDTRFVFRVAVECEGLSDSAWSAASSGATLPLPAARPSGVEISSEAELTDTALALAWRPGALNQCVPKGFRVEKRKAGDSTWNAAAGCDAVQRGADGGVLSCQVPRPFSECSRVVVGCAFRLSAAL